MAKIQLEKLLQLADLLDRVPPEQFSMRTWARRKGRVLCATTACAGGWAATLWPNELRLKRWCESCGIIEHVATGLEEYDALMEFFGLTLYQSIELFGWDENSHNETPQTKAAHLRRFVQEHKPKRKRSSKVADRRMGL